MTISHLNTRKRLLQVGERWNIRTTQTTKHKWLFKLKLIRFNYIKIQFIKCMSMPSNHMCIAQITYCSHPCRKFHWEAPAHVVDLMLELYTCHFERQPVGRGRGVRGKEVSEVMKEEVEEVQYILCEGICWRASLPWTRSITAHSCWVSQTARLISLFIVSSLCS